MNISRLFFLKVVTQMLHKMAAFAPVLAGIIAFVNCSNFQQDNPMDTNGTDWHQPTISAMSDTTVWVGDVIQIHANGSAGKGSIKTYEWCYANGMTLTTAEGVLDTSFSAAGTQIISVKAIDNDGVPSEAATITVSVLNKPVLAVSTTAISLGSTLNSATFSITNAGGGTLQWTISSNTAWLTVLPQSGSTSTVGTVITVVANSNGLASGNYTGNITVTAGSASKVITVTMSVAPVLAVSTTSISLGSILAGATFSITNAGNGTLQWTTSSDATWLTVTPTSGSTTTTGSVINVAVNRNGLTSASYTGNVTVTAGGVSKVITVTISVDLPVLSVSTSSILLGTTLNSSTFSITNTGGGTLSWTISTNVAWLSVSPTSGNTSTIGSVITVMANRSSLAIGNSSGTITITSGSATKTVLVTIVKVPTTITVTNDLILPVDVSVNSVYAKTVPALTTLIDTVSSSLSNMTVSWELDNVVGGLSKGQSMDSTFPTVQNPAGNYNYSITNIVGITSYFAPYIVNNSSSSVILAVNWGTVAQVDYTGYIAASGVAELGYYRLYSNTEVIAYPYGSNYTGNTYWYWNYGTNFTYSSITPNSGVVDLTLTP
jgi:Viral BACON domain